MNHPLFRLNVSMLIILTSMLFIMPARAESTIVVDTTTDGVASDGLCSLREAVIAANTDSASGDCIGGSGADTIVFDSALPRPAIFVLTQSGPNEDAARTGDLDILGTLMIKGASGFPTDIVFGGNGADRVLHVHPNANVTLSGVTIRNGNPGISANGGGILAELTSRVTITNSQIISNSALNGGGAHALGRLTISNSRVEGNQGDGISNDAGLTTLTNVEIVNNLSGYGIRNQSSGVLIADDTVVSNNQGVGIFNQRSTATLTALQIANNTGGGVHSSGEVSTRLTLNRSVVMSNTATDGAGIFNEGIGATAIIVDTQISRNKATAAGGGILNNGIMTVQTSTIDRNEARAGGGIRNLGGALTLVNDTISANVASDNGGGIYNSASATLDHVTLVNNQSSTGSNLFNNEAGISLQSSIVAMPHGGTNCSNSLGTISSTGYNLESTDSCNLTAVGDQVNIDPQLDSLVDNGGPTDTHAPMPGSPAIDTGMSVPCPTIDQRGVSRPQGAACDIGAYELEEPIADELIVNLVASSDSPTELGQTTRFTATVDSGTNVSYSWDFGDGVSDIGATVSHIYGAAGTYSATVIATNGHGSFIDTTGIIITEPIILDDPIVGLVAGSDSPTTLGTATNFSATISSGTNVSYSWDFGDGGNGTGANVSHTYTTVGTFVAAVTVTNSVDTVVANTSVQVDAVAPPVDTQAPSVPDGLTLLDIMQTSVTFTWNPANDDVGVVGYRIYEMVGLNQSSDQWVLRLDNLTGGTATIENLQPGTFHQFAASAFDAAGNESARSARIDVTTYLLPQAYHSAIPGELISAVADELFRYDVDAIGNPTPTFSLVAGPAGMTVDAVTGLVEWMPMIADVGFVTPTIRATNSIGRGDHTFTLPVQGAGTDLEPPSAITNLVATDISAFGCTLTWTPVEDNIGVAGYKILAQKDGHGTSLFIVADSAGIATTARVTSMDPESGYRLWVSPYDEAGNEAPISGATPVHVTTLAAPDAGITGLAATNDGPSTLGNPINFSAVISSGTGVEYSWNFGDGSTGTGAVATHTYAAPGSYTASVTVVNGVSSDMVTTTVMILAPPPTYTVPISIYLSSSTGGRVAGVGFADEDVLVYDTEGGSWARYFDGSDVGLARTDVDAFALLDDGSLLLSLNKEFDVQGLGLVDDSDIVRFVPVGLGTQTNGIFEWYFDGSDVGLDKDGEDVDALTILADGRLIVSTSGGYKVTGASGKDEDLVAFTPTQLGESTSGSWVRYFDGSDVGLNSSTYEDVWGVSIDVVSGDIHLSTRGAFDVSDLVGTGADLFTCMSNELGAKTNCLFRLLLDGSASGLDGEVIDGVSITQRARTPISRNAVDLLSVDEFDDRDDFAEPEDVDGSQWIFLPVVSR